MTTAAEFARCAAAIGTLALQVKPDDSNPYAQTRKLIQYHLLAAAKHTREIAEALTAKEPPQ